MVEGAASCLSPQWDVKSNAPIEEQYFRKELESTYSFKAEKQSWGSSLLCHRLLEMEFEPVKSVQEFNAQVQRRGERRKLVHLTSEYLEKGGWIGFFLTCVHRIWNILKACFNCSDWQQAVRILREEMKKEILCGGEVDPSQRQELFQTIDKNAERYLELVLHAARQMDQLQKEYPQDHWNNVDNGPLQKSISKINGELDQAHEEVMDFDD